MKRALAVAFGLAWLVSPAWTQASPGLIKTPDAQDPFVGVWRMNPDKSEPDVNHRAMAARLYWERDGDAYRVTAEGINASGKAVKETPQKFLPDGREHSVAGAAGVTAVVTRPEPNRIEVESRKDGDVIGRASYVVSKDGKTLAATVSGTDGKQRAFRARMIFDRE